MNQEKLKYPIGKFKSPEQIDFDTRKSMIKDIADLPIILREVISPLNEEQLNTPYRSGGWTVRQVVHHLADSHCNSQIRFKLALTEKMPTIKPYNETLWAELPDGKNENPEMSLLILKGIHTRWTHLLNHMSDDDFNKKLIHPEYPNPLNLNTMLALYSWHCRHHTAHITELIKRENW